MLIGNILTLPIPYEACSVFTHEAKHGFSLPSDPSNFSGIWGAEPHYPGHSFVNIWSSLVGLDFTFPPLQPVDPDGEEVGLLCSFLSLCSIEVSFMPSLSKVLCQTLTPVFCYTVLSLLLELGKGLDYQQVLGNKTHRLICQIITFAFT